MVHVCISIPKIPTWVYFGGPWNVHCKYILLLDILYGHLVYISCFGMLFQVKSGNPGGDS
jgi:hypothetical protein